MPPVVAAVAVMAVSTTATFAAIGATYGIIGAAVAGAVVGAVAGGATAAITGGDIGKGALSGALSGAVAGGVSGFASGASWTGGGEAVSGAAGGMSGATSGVTTGAEAGILNTGSQSLGQPALYNAGVGGQSLATAPQGGIIGQGVSPDMAALLKSNEAIAAANTKSQMVGKALSSGASGLMEEDPDEARQKMTDEQIRLENSRRVDLSGVEDYISNPTLRKNPYTQNLENLRRKLRGGK